MRNKRIQGLAHRFQTVYRFRAADALIECAVTAAAKRRQRELFSLYNWKCSRVDNYHASCEYFVIFPAF